MSAKKLSIADSIAARFQVEGGPKTVPTRSLSIQSEPNRTPSILTHKQGKKRFSHDDPLTPVPENTTAGDLDFIDTLVTGNFAQIVRVRRRDTGQIMVAKAFVRNSWRSEYLCKAELRVLQNVDSPWIIGYFGYIEDFHEDFLLLEYLPYGNFFQLLRKIDRLKENQVKFYSAEMFLAVNSLHQEGIMHRNIQLSNFLVHSSGHLRLCDFGLSYQFREPGDSKSDTDKKLITSPVYATAEKAVPLNVRDSVRDGASTSSAEDEQVVVSECTTSYLAPEVLRLLVPKPYFTLIKRKVGYSFLCDYWSLGVAVYHMLYLNLPFQADNKGGILDKVLDYRRTLTFPIDHHHMVSLTGVTLVKELLKKESKRLGTTDGFQEVKDHVFFADVSWDLLGHGKVNIPAKESDIAKYTQSVSVQPGMPSRPILLQPDSSEESDDDVSTAVETLNFNKLMFAIPLGEDPSLRVYNLAADQSDKRQSISKTRKDKAGPSRPTTSPKKRKGEAKVVSSLHNRSDNVAAERNKQVKQAEKTFLDTLMAWFRTSN